MEQPMTPIAPIQKSIRASSAPLASLCAASQTPDPLVVASGGKQADLGSAGHETLACRLTGREFDIGDIASKYEVDRDELAVTAAWLWSSWLKVSEYFPVPRSEVPLEYTDEPNAFRLTGTIDVLSDCDGLRILDAKTGYLDMDFSAQLRAYSLLALKNNPDHDRVYAAVLHMRNRKFLPVSDGREHGYYYRDELERWWDDFAKHLRSGAYNSGKHCQYCRRSTTCPKITGELVQARRVLTEQLIEGTAEQIAELLPNDPVELGRIGVMVHDALSLFDKRSKVWKEALKTRINAAGGEVPDGNGRKLVVVKQEQHPLKATRDSLSYALSVVPVEQFDDVFGIGKGALEKAIKATAGRGQKKAVWEETLQKFEAMGCVETKTIERLEVHQVASQLEESHEHGDSAV